MAITTDCTHSPKHRCWAQIDLAALERNLGRIRTALPSHIQYIAVVKADAYGHGIHPTTTRLMQSAADAFAVANVYEAVAIREIGTGWPIILLSALLPEEERYLIEYDLTATVSTSEEVERLEQLGQRHHRSIPVHMKIDTGMGRLGVWHEDASNLFQQIKAAKHINLQGIFTHFSSADTHADFTQHQRKLFFDTLQSLPNLNQSPLLIHADNSAGLETFSHDSPVNAVRIGLLQFGLLPYPDSFLASLRTEPVMSFQTRIGIIKDLPQDTPISYGRTYTLKRPSRIAILTAGYGDGIPTAVSNRAQVLIHGTRCPVLGRVTMDQTIVDVTELPQASPGDTVTLIGRQHGNAIEVSEFAAWAQSIPWEIFCSITKRVPRVYHTDRSL